MYTTGFTYERANITKWFESHKRSPMTGLTLSSTRLTANNNLRSLIREWSDKNKAQATMAQKDSAEALDSLKKKRGSGDQLQIFVKTLTGQTLTIRASSSGLVQDVVDAIHDREGIDPSAQRLIFGGKQLEFDKALSSYSIQDESTLVHTNLSGVPTCTLFWSILRSHLHFVCSGLPT